MDSGVMITPKSKQVRSAMNTGELSCAQAQICLVLFGPPVSAAGLSIVPTDLGISEARVFSGPLLPAGGATSPVENRDEIARPRAPPRGRGFSGQVSALPLARLPAGPHGGGVSPQRPG